MRYLFCNIGWMEHYKGQNKKDRISGGGAFVEQKKRGHEVCNFLEHKNWIYGYVRSGGKDGQINIERLGAAPSEETIDDITVVWTAKNDKTDQGTVVRGWYKNATVYKFEQKAVSNRHKRLSAPSFYIKAKARDAKLLTVDEGTIEIPRRKRGYMGQSNVWFADAPERKPFLRKVAKLIGGTFRIQPIPSKKARSRQPDPEKKAKVEQAAMKKTEMYFQRHGYTVERVENKNRGWDLEATRGTTLLNIEVKGLSGDTPNVELTYNEFVNAFSKQEKNYRLCVVYSALTKPTLLICRYSHERGTWMVEEKPTAKLKITPRPSAFVEIRGA